PRGPAQRAGLRSRKEVVPELAPGDARDPRTRRSEPEIGPRGSRPSAAQPGAGDHGAHRHRGLRGLWTRAGTPPPPRVSGRHRRRGHGVFLVADDFRGPRRFPEDRYQPHQEHPSESHQTGPGPLHAPGGRSHRLPGHRRGNRDRRGVSGAADLRGALGAGVLLRTTGTALPVARARRHGLLGRPFGPNFPEGREAESSMGSSFDTALLTVAAIAIVAGVVATALAVLSVGLLRRALRRLSDGLTELRRHPLVGALPVESDKALRILAQELNDLLVDLRARLLETEKRSAGLAGLAAGPPDLA